MKKKMKNHDQQADETAEVVVEPTETLEAMPAEEGAPIPGDDDIPEAFISDDDRAGEEDSLLSALRLERDAAQDQLLRVRADFDNFRRRVARENEQLRKTATQALMRDLLPVVDNMERALSHVEDKTDGLALGVEMILKQFSGVLSNQGLEPIPAKGEPFDPNVHEALTHQPSNEYPADTVTEEFQRGYRLSDFVLRPAQVVVSSGPPVGTENSGDASAENPDDNE